MSPTYLTLLIFTVFFLSLILLRRRAQRQRQLEIFQNTPEVVNPESKTTEPISPLADLGFDTIEKVLPATKEKEEKYIKPGTLPRTQPTLTQESNIIVLHVMAPPNQAFLGYELIQALVNVDLRHGPMKIFHRYEHNNGQGNILFSVAQATEPGIFDINDIGALRCLGLSIFMHTNPDQPALPIFNLMLEAAQQLAEDLDGKLEDIQHQPLTSQMIANYRKKLDLVLA